MGILITIGNATYMTSEDPEISADWTVIGIDRPNAPTAGCTPMKSSNIAEFSYTSFDGFLSWAKLEDLFKKETTGLVRDHPGCVLITRYDHVLVQSALDEKSNDPQPHKRYMADLRWLDWWMAYALRTADRPSLMNR